jgi:hypothetical protein
MKGWETCWSITRQESHLRPRRNDSIASKVHFISLSYLDFSSVHIYTENESLHMQKSSSILQDQPSIPFAPLVNLGLRQAGNLRSTILNLSIGRLESAQNTGAFLDRVVARQLVVCNAVQSAVT